MPVEVIGIDHIYLAVRSLERSEAFYDRVMMQVLGYRKGRSMIGGDPHVHYFNRSSASRCGRAHLQSQEHDPYAAGLHHFCFRVFDARGGRSRRRGAARAGRRRQHAAPLPGIRARLLRNVSLPIRTASGWRSRTSASSGAGACSIGTAMRPAWPRARSSSLRSSAATARPSTPL
jgi:catechol 2,3-dioxygenase-like lactoylglutathione lyase family enzyme